MYYKYGSFYMKREKSDLIGFIDNYYAENQYDIRSICRYVFKLGSGAISWSSTMVEKKYWRTLREETRAYNNFFCDN